MQNTINYYKSIISVVNNSLNEKHFTLSELSLSTGVSEEKLKGVCEQKIFSLLSLTENELLSLEKLNNL